MTKLNREQWLTRMASHLKLLFEINGYEFKRGFRVSCGLPSKGAFNRKGRVIGECWASDCSKEGINEIFISPTQAESLEVAAILAHEMVHAYDDCKNGHRKPFRDVAKAIGLAGPMRSTHASMCLDNYIQAGIESMRIGPYPHEEMDYKPKKTDGTRLIKVYCPNSMCDYYWENKEKPYSVRMSRTCIEYGYPKCGVCATTMVED